MIYRIVKRAFDVLGASVGLIVASPVLIFLAIAIKITSPGPVLYRGKRVGQGGRLFHLLKFRTMVPEAENIGGSATANDDVRLTSFGRKIRRYKLDELPQLWNVLVGEMSFVGPRPEVEKFVAAYTRDERRILELSPGLTDWATIWNSDEGAALAGRSDPENFYRDFIRPVKTELQLLYYSKRSFVVDAKILFHTAVKLFSSEWVPKELNSYGTSLRMGRHCGRAGNTSNAVKS